MMERGRIYWMIIVPLKEWKWVGVDLEAWDLKKISQDLSGFVVQFLFYLGTKFES
jgi:hypothetical protein